MLTMRFEPRTGWRPERRSQQFVNDVVDPALGDGLWNTSPQMRLEDVPADPIQCSLHRRDLMEHIDAVTVLVHHADHPVEVTAGRTKLEPHRARIGPHRLLSSARRRSS